MVEQLEQDFRLAALSSRQRGMLEYADKLTRAPWTMREADVIALREAGLSDGEILDLNQVTGYFAFANRLADGLGIELEPVWGESARRVDE